MHGQVQSVSKLDVVKAPGDKAITPLPVLSFPVTFCTSALASCSGHGSLLEFPHPVFTPQLLLPGTHSMVFLQLVQSMGLLCLIYLCRGMEGRNGHQTKGTRDSLLLSLLFFGGLP